MNIANILFYVLLFFGFFLPTNNSMYIPVPGVLLEFSELAFLLLPIVNVFCRSPYHGFTIDRRLSNYIFLYLFFVFFTEFFIKPIVFEQSLSDSFRAFRLGIPLYSSLLLIFVGIKADIRIVWTVMLWAIGISILLSVISIFVYIPIYYNLEDTDILQMSNGRIMNSNASFGVIGICLLFSRREVWYNQGLLVRAVSILGVVSLLLTFNRTYLTLFVLLFIYLSYITFSKKFFFKITFIPVVFVGLIIILYNNVEIIQWQIDRRILSIVFQETSLVESTIESNRDEIYLGIQEKMEKGYWVFGLPYDVPIFIRSARFGLDSQAFTTTDTSFANILLRFGIFPLLLYWFILKRIVQVDRNKAFSIVFFVYLFASLNLDSLMGQNSILFLVLYFCVTNFQVYEKNSLYC